MRALLVVLDHPTPDHLAHVFETGEQVLVEYFLTEGSIEAFDVDVLARFAGLYFSPPKIRSRSRPFEASA